TTDHPSYADASALADSVLPREAGGPVAAVERISSARYHTWAPTVLDSPVSLSLTVLSITPITKPSSWTGVPGAIESPGLDSATTETLIIVYWVWPKLLNPADRWASHFGVPSLVVSCSVDLNASLGSTPMSITKSNVCA